LQIYPPLKPIQRISLLLQQRMGGLGGEGHFYAGEQVFVFDAVIGGDVRDGHRDEVDFTVSRFRSPQPVVWSKQSELGSGEVNEQVLKRSGSQPSLG